MPPKLPTTLNRVVGKAAPSVRLGTDSSVLLRDPYITADIRPPSIAPLAKAVEGVAQNIKRKEEERTAAKDKFAFARAKTSLLERRLAIEEEINQEPDYTKHEEMYNEKMQKAVNEIQSTFNLKPDYMESFRLDARQEIAIGRSRIASVAEEKRRDMGKAQYYNDRSKLIETIALTNDPVQREKLWLNASDLTDGAFGNMFISDVQALSDKAELPREVAKLRVSIAPPDEVLDALAPVKRVSVVDFIKDATSKSGIDPKFALRVASIESGGDVGAVNEKTRASGIFQFMPEVAKEFGITDPTDYKQATEGFIELTKRNEKALEKELGRKPTNEELYLAHQQGAKGASELLTNPDRPAVDVLADVYGSRTLALSAITLNGGDPTDSSKKFVSRWAKKYNNTKPLKDAESIEHQPETKGMYQFLSAAEQAAAVEDALERKAIDAIDTNPSRFLAEEKGGVYDLLPLKKRIELRGIGEKELERSVVADLSTQIENENKILEDIVHNPEISPTQKIAALRRLELEGSKVRGSFVTKAASYISAASSSKIKDGYYINDQGKQEKITSSIIAETYNKHLLEMESLMKDAGMSSPDGELKINRENLQKYRDFIDSVYADASGERPILSEAKVRTLTGTMTQALRNAINNNATAVSLFEKMQPGVQDPYLEGIKKIKERLKNRGEENDQIKLMNTVESFVRNLGDYESTGNTAKDMSVINEAVDVSLDYPSSSDTVATIDEVMPRPGDIVSGYVFIGGDPNIAANWKTIDE